MASDLSIFVIIIVFGKSLQGLETNKTSVFGATVERARLFMLKKWTQSKCM